jgi:hypothetical protein
VGLYRPRQPSSQRCRLLSQVREKAGTQKVKVISRGCCSRAREGSVQWDEKMKEHPGRLYVENDPRAFVKKQLCDLHMEIASKIVEVMTLPIDSTKHIMFPSSSDVVVRGQTFFRGPFMYTRLRIPWSWLHWLGKPHEKSAMHAGAPARPRICSLVFAHSLGRWCCSCPQSII